MARKQDMTQSEAEKILDLPERYDKRALRKSFMALAQKYHPDNAATNGISPDEAQCKMTQVNKAYALLKTYFEDNAEATLHRDMMGGEEGRYGVGVHFSPTGQKVGKTQVDDSLFWDKDGNPRSAVAEKNANDAVDAAPGTHRLRRFLLGPVFLRVAFVALLALLWWAVSPVLPANAGRFNVGVDASLLDYVGWLAAFLYPTYFLVYELLAGHISGSVREAINGLISLQTRVHVNIRPSGSYTSELTSLIQKQWYGPLELPLAGFLVALALSYPLGGDALVAGWPWQKVLLMAGGAFFGIDGLLGCFGSGFVTGIARSLGNAVEKRYVTMRMNMLKRCGQWASARHAR